MGIYTVCAMLPGLLAALLLQVDPAGGGIGVLAAIVAVVALFFVMNGLWRSEKQRKTARDKKIAAQLLERIGQAPGDPINPSQLARIERLPTAVVRDICEGKLLKEGYLHRKKRPMKDREEKLFLTPSGVEATQRRKPPTT
jgi:DNA-binding MarR family transcriptional regulator